MGVLYARVSGAWVPVGNGYPPFDPSPAYIGPRPDFTSDAWHGRVDTGGTLGMGVRGPNLVYINMPSNGQFQVNPAGGSGAMLAVHNTAVLAGGWNLGTHPVYGSNYDALWSDYARNNISGSHYTVMTQRNNGTTYLNGHGAVYIRSQNNDKIVVQDSRVDIIQQLYANGINCGYITTNQATIDAGRIVATNGQFRNAYSPPSGSWDVQNVACSGYGNLAAVALNSPGYAVCMRNSVWSGSPLEVLSLDMSVWVPVYAGAFSVQSSATIKKDVRDLHRQQERIVVRHDPMADEVPPLDIMSLHPVAFRPKQPNRKMVPAPGYDEIDPKDRDSWVIVDEDNPNLAIQGTRERLGLIAEEVQHVVPSAVSYDRDGNPLGVDYAQITVALLDHVQQLTETIATLKYRITELENAR